MLSKLALLLIFASPGLSVEWLNDVRESVQIEVNGGDDFIEPCLDGGLHVSYRYEMHICRSRTLWLDTCSETKLRIHTLGFDPVSQEYLVQEDLLRDNAPPAQSRFSDYDEAIAAVATIHGMPLITIASGNIAALDQRRVYVAIRVVGECRGAYTKTLARLSSFLTFGISDINEFNTDWVDFQLGR